MNNAPTLPPPHSTGAQDPVGLWLCPVYQLSSMLTHTEQEGLSLSILNSSLEPIQPLYQRLLSSLGCTERRGAVQCRSRRISP